MSDLNSGVNERRGRSFFLALVSMMGMLSRPKPQIADVRHGGSTPERWNPFTACAAQGSCAALA
jgi:hypothetical protein